MHTLFLVLGILGIQAAIWIPIIIWMNRRTAALVRSLEDSLVLSGELVVLGPEAALYRGATSGYTKVENNCVIALTGQSIVFETLLGGRHRIPLSAVADVTEDKWFKGKYRDNRKNLILHLRDGAKVGFIVSNHDEWMRALGAGVADT